MANPDSRMTAQERRLTIRAADRAPRAQIDGHTRIEVDLVATVRDTQPRGG